MTATEPRRLAERVAAEIEKGVIDSGWPVGAIIGSEPELIAKHQVSRAVFREAARIVEHHDVARMRRGPGGGLVVTAPDPSATKTAVGLYLRYRKISAAQMFEARSTLELEAIALTTSRLDDADGVERLRKALEYEASIREPDPLSSHHLHVVIAELTGNPVLSLFIEVVADVEAAIVAERDWFPAPRPEAARASLRAHKLIVEAMLKGDASLAQHRMRVHLSAISRLRTPPR